jgi:hypothetical protein
MEIEESPMMLALAELRNIIQTLNEDVSAHIDVLFSEEYMGLSRNIRRRQFVRSVYAFYDGSSYAIKQVSLQRVHELKLDIKPGEMQMLREYEVHLDSQGRVKERPARINTISNIRFSLEVYARIHGVPCPVSWGDSGWGDLQAGITIRDRLTHPKKAEHLVVSDEEILQVMRAVLWFTVSLKKVMAAALTIVAAETSNGETIIRNLFPDGLPS